jgi:hypothetical protein
MKSELAPYTKLICFWYCPQRMHAVCAAALCRNFGICILLKLGATRVLAWPRLRHCRCWRQRHTTYLHNSHNCSVLAPCLFLLMLLWCTLLDYRPDLWLCALCLWFMMQLWFVLCGLCALWLCMALALPFRYCLCAFRADCLCLFRLLATCAFLWWLCIDRCNCNCAAYLFYIIRLSACSEEGGTGYALLPQCYRGSFWVASSSLRSSSLIVVVAAVAYWRSEATL